MVNYTPETMKGLVSPFITPTDRNGIVNEEWVYSLTLHQAGHIDGALIGGETGGFRHQTIDQRISMFDKVVMVRNEIPHDKRFFVLFNATCKSVSNTIDMIKYAEEKADGIVIAPLFIYPNPEVSISILNRIANASKLPIFIYDNAAITDDPQNGIIGPDNLREIMKHPNIKGVKASSGDLKLFYKYDKIAKQAGGRAFMGNERMMKYAPDVVPSLANIYPDICRQLLDAPDRNAKAELQEKVNQIGEQIYIGYTKIQGGLMHALKCRGICYPEQTNPEQQLTDIEKRDVAICVSLLGGRVPTS